MKRRSLLTALGLAPAAAVLPPPAPPVEPTEIPLRIRPASSPSAPVTSWKPAVKVDCPDTIGRCSSCPRPAAGWDSIEPPAPQSVVDFMHCLSCQRSRRREQYMLDQIAGR